MTSIIHIYRLEGATTDEFVDANFADKFLHIHIVDSSDQIERTYLLKKMDFVGSKLDPAADSNEICWLMEFIAANPEVQAAAKKFFDTSCSPPPV